MICFTACFFCCCLLFLLLFTLLYSFLLSFTLLRVFYPFLLFPTMPGGYTISSRFSHHACRHAVRFTPQREDRHGGSSAASAQNPPRRFAFIAMTGLVFALGFCFSFYVCFSRRFVNCCCCFLCRQCLAQLLAGLDSVAVRCLVAHHAVARKNRSV